MAAQEQPSVSTEDQSKAGRDPAPTLTTYRDDLVIPYTYQPAVAPEVQPDGLSVPSAEHAYLSNLGNLLCESCGLQCSSELQYAVHIRSCQMGEPANIGSLAWLSTEVAHVTEAKVNTVESDRGSISEAKANIRESLLSGHCGLASQSDLNECNVASGDFVAYGIQCENGHLEKVPYRLPSVSTILKLPDNLRNNDQLQITPRSGLTLNQHANKQLSSSCTESDDRDDNNYKQFNAEEGSILNVSNQNITSISQKRKYKKKPKLDLNTYCIVCNTSFCNTESLARHLKTLKHEQMASLKGVLTRGQAKTCGNLKRNQRTRLQGTRGKKRDVDLTENHRFYKKKQKKVPTCKVRSSNRLRNINSDESVDSESLENSHDNSLHETQLAVQDLQLVNVQETASINEAINETHDILEQVLNSDEKIDSETLEKSHDNSSHETQQAVPGLQLVNVQETALTNEPINETHDILEQVLKEEKHKQSSSLSMDENTKPQDCGNISVYVQDEHLTMEDALSIVTNDVARSSNAEITQVMPKGNKHCNGDTFVSSVEGFFNQVCYETSDTGQPCSYTYVYDPSLQGINVAPTGAVPSLRFEPYANFHSLNYGSDPHDFNYESDTQNLNYRMNLQGLNYDPNAKSNMQSSNDEHYKQSLNHESYTENLIRDSYTQSLNQKQNTQNLDNEPYAWGMNHVLNAKGLNHKPNRQGLNPELNRQSLNPDPNRQSLNPDPNRQSLNLGQNRQSLGCESNFLKINQRRHTLSMNDEAYKQSFSVDKTDGLSDIIIKPLGAEHIGNSDHNIYHGSGDLYLPSSVKEIRDTNKAPLETINGNCLTQTTEESSNVNELGYFSYILGYENQNYAQGFYQEPFNEAFGGDAITGTTNTTNYAYDDVGSTQKTTRHDYTKPYNGTQKNSGNDFDCSVNESVLARNGASDSPPMDFNRKVAENTLSTASSKYVKTLTSVKEDGDLNCDGLKHLGAKKNEDLMCCNTIFSSKTALKRHKQSNRHKQVILYTPFNHEVQKTCASDGEEQEKESFVCCSRKYLSMKKLKAHWKAATHHVITNDMLKDGKFLEELQKVPKQIKGEIDSVQDTGIVKTKDTRADELQNTGIANVKDIRADELQDTVIANAKDTRADGLQTTEIANGKDTRADGLQTTEIANVKDIRADGLQSTGIANMKDIRADDLQGTRIANAKDIRADGLQGTGIAYAKDIRADGLQNTGIAYGKDIRADGLQSTGIANAKDIRADGLQTTEIGNAKDTETDELQDTGIANAKDIRVDGLQNTGIAKAKYTEGDELQDTGIANAKDIRADGQQNTGIAYGKDIRADGLQSTGIANAKDIRADGLQSTGIAEAKDIRADGLQDTGTFYAQEAGDGLQDTGIAYTKDTGTDGLQDTGVVFTQDTGTDGQQDTGLAYTKVTRADGLLNSGIACIQGTGANGKNEIKCTHVQIKGKEDSNKATGNTEHITEDDKREIKSSCAQGIARVNSNTATDTNSLASQMEKVENSVIDSACIDTESVEVDTNSCSKVQKRCANLTNFPPNTSGRFLGFIGDNKSRSDKRHSDKHNITNKGITTVREPLFSSMNSFKSSGKQTSDKKNTVVYENGKTIPITSVEGKDKVSDFVDTDNRQVATKENTRSCKSGKAAFEQNKRLRKILCSKPRKASATTQSMNRSHHSFEPTEVRSKCQGIGKNDNPDARKRQKVCEPIKSVERMKLIENVDSEQTLTPYKYKQMSDRVSQLKGKFKKVQKVSTTNVMNQENGLLRKGQSMDVQICDSQCRENGLNTRKPKIGVQHYSQHSGTKECKEIKNNVERKNMEIARKGQTMYRHCSEQPKTLEFRSYVSSITSESEYSFSYEHSTANTSFEGLDSEQTHERIKKENVVPLERTKKLPAGRKKKNCSCNTCQTIFASPASLRRHIKDSRVHQKKLQDTKGNAGNKSETSILEPSDIGISKSVGKDLISCTGITIAKIDNGKGVQIGSSPATASKATPTTASKARHFCANSSTDSQPSNIGDSLEFSDGRKKGESIECPDGKEDGQRNVCTSTCSVCQITFASPKGHVKQPLCQQHSLINLHDKEGINLLEASISETSENYMSKPVGADKVLKDGIEIVQEDKKDIDVPIGNKQIPSTTTRHSSANSSLDSQPPSMDDSIKLSDDIDLNLTDGQVFGNSKCYEVFNSEAIKHIEDRFDGVISELRQTGVLDDNRVKLKVYNDDLVATCENELRDKMKQLSTKTIKIAEERSPTYSDFIDVYIEDTVDDTMELSSIDSQWEYTNDNGVIGKVDPLNVVNKNKSGLFDSVLETDCVDSFAKEERKQAITETDENEISDVEAESLNVLSANEMGVVKERLDVESIDTEVSDENNNVKVVDPARKYQATRMPYRGLQLKRKLLVGHKNQKRRIIETPGYRIVDADNVYTSDDDVSAIDSGVGSIHSPSERSVVSDVAVESIGGDDTGEMIYEMQNENVAAVVMDNWSHHAYCHVCNLCDRRFSRWKKLREHMKTHTGKRAFVCSMYKP